MMRKIPILALVLAVGIIVGALGNQVLNAQPNVSPIAVPSKGLHSTIKYEHVIAGWLTDVNGKYKLRISEVKLDPEGYVGDHQHRGPGIRWITSGNQTVVSEGKSTSYKSGDFYFEAGNVTASASNKGAVTLLQFEILPADLKGGSSFVPLK